MATIYVDEYDYTNLDPETESVSDIALDDSDLESRYDEMLDEVYPEVELPVGSWAMSDLLQRLDPIQYRCGFNDWLDSEVHDGNILEVEV